MISKVGKNSNLNKSYWSEGFIVLIFLQASLMAVKKEGMESPM